MKKIFLLIIVLLVCSVSGCKKKNTEYTVTFVNGEQSETVKYNENDSVEFNTLSKEGYVFNGWTLNGELVTNYKVTSDVTFVASFSKAKYNVNFVINGKTETKEFEYGDSVVFPNAEIEGSTFTGWTLNGEVVNSYIVKEEVTFVATYSNVKFNVKFDIDGQITTVEYVSGSSVEFPNASKEGYEFTGWTLNGEVVDSHVVKEEVTFVATYNKLKFNVNFNVNGVIETVEYEYGDEVEFTVPDIEGCSFDNWTLNGEVVDSYIVKDEVTFVATFSKLKFNISFDIDGVVETVEYEYGDTVVFKPIEKEGYIFNGWTLDGELVDNHVVIGIATFVASFTEIDYVGLAKEYLTNLLPAETVESFTLPTEYEKVTISWKTSNAKAITTLGEVTQLEYKATVTLTATFTYNGTSTTAKYKVVVPKLDDEVILNNVLNSYEFDGTVKDQVVNLKQDFSTTNSTITCVWESLDKEFLSDSGYVLNYLDSEKEVQIKLTLTLRNASVSATYKVVIPGMSVEELAELALVLANIDTYVTNKNVCLPTEFEYNLIGSWSSEDENVIDNNGNVKISNNIYKEVKMTLTLKKSDGMEVKTMEYTFKVHNKTHLPIVHASEFNENNMNNVELENGRLVLKNGQTYGEYESDILETINFDNCVPSWAAVTSTNATVEFQIRARVNGTWSKYIAYSNGGWGLGLQNKASNQSDSLVKLSTDEFMVLNSKFADAIQFKLILRRTTSSNESPKVSLCSFALKGTNYSAPTYSLNDLPSNVKHDVPKLYQQVVPTIGNSICSPTSCTMLLKHKGLSFTDKDAQYEHRYIANLAKDYGNGIFGNWVYNTVTMSAFGFNAYVARFYSVAELCHHIATVGPVACSMKGQMTSDMKDYYTSGHLITIIGYEYNNGVLTLISNDPNVSQVECRYSESVFTTTWRNISYIIE